MKNTTLTSSTHSFRIWSIVGILIVGVYALYKNSPVPYTETFEPLLALNRVAHHFDAQTRSTEGVRHFLHEVAERMMRDPHARYYDCQDTITLDIVAAAAQNTPGLHNNAKSKEFLESLRTSLIKLVVEHPHGPCRHRRQVSARTLGHHLKQFAETF
jgi:hypothetical protein